MKLPFFLRVDLTDFILDHARFVGRATAILFIVFFSLSPYIWTAFLLYRKLFLHYHLSYIKVFSPALSTMGLGAIMMIWAHIEIKKGNYVKLSKKQAAKFILEHAPNEIEKKGKYVRIKKDADVHS